MPRIDRFIDPDRSTRPSSPSPYPEGYIPVKDYVIRWITEDGQEHEHTVPNIDRVSKWMHLEFVQDLMPRPDVVEIAAYRYLTDGEVKRGKLIEQMEMVLRKQYGGYHSAGVGEAREFLKVANKHGYKLREGFLP